MGLNKQDALKLVDEFSTLLSDYCNTITVFYVGSLAEDDYRESSSDIDVIVIIENEANLEDIKKTSEEIIKTIKKKHKTDIEFEAFVKQEKEVFPPYEFGQNQTIEAMRLRKQAKLVKGKFNPLDIPIPSKKDFLKDAVLRDKRILDEKGENFIDQLNQKNLINLIIEYFRLELIVCHEYTEFNKTKLIKEYHNRNLIDSKMYEILINMRNNELMTEDKKTIARQFAKQKRKDILIMEKEEREKNDDIVH